MQFASFKSNTVPETSVGESASLRQSACANVRLPANQRPIRQTAISDFVQSDWVRDETNRPDAVFSRKILKFSGKILAVYTRVQINRLEDLTDKLDKILMTKSQQGLVQKKITHFQ